MEQGESYNPSSENDKAIQTINQNKIGELEDLQSLVHPINAEENMTGLEDLQSLTDIALSGVNNDKITGLEDLQSLTDMALSGTNNDK